MRKQVADSDAIRNEKEKENEKGKETINILNRFAGILPDGSETDEKFLKEERLRRKN